MPTAAEPTNKQFEFVSAFIDALQALSAFVLRLLWSDEAAAIFGTSFFYPIIASTLFIVTVALMPAGVVKRCQCYCFRKFRYLARAVEVNGHRFYSKVSFLMDAFPLQEISFMLRPTLLGSARAVVGTIFTINF